jgi:hypothetical protein
LIPVAKMNTRWEQRPAADGLISTMSLRGQGGAWCIETTSRDFDA